MMEVDGAGDEGKAKRVEDAYKTFTFWVRVNLGATVGSPLHA